MAVAVTIKARDFTARKHVVADLAFSGTYTTGGEAPTNGFQRELGLSGIDAVGIEPGNLAAQPTLGVTAKYEYTTDKVTLWRTDQVDDFMEELPNGTSIANITLRGRFTGPAR